MSAAGGVHPDWFTVSYGRVILTMNLIPLALENKMPMNSCRSSRAARQLSYGSQLYIKREERENRRIKKRIVTLFIIRYERRYIPYSLWITAGLQHCWSIHQNELRCCCCCCQLWGSLYSLRATTVSSRKYFQSSHFTRSGQKEKNFQACRKIVPFCCFFSVGRERRERFSRDP